MKTSRLLVAAVSASVLWLGCKKEEKEDQVQQAVLPAVTVADYLGEYTASAQGSSATFVMNVFSGGGNDLRLVSIRIEHIGIAVKDLAEAEALYHSLLGRKLQAGGRGERRGDHLLLPVGPNKIELLESTRSDGPIAKAIEKRGEGIHHIAFEVADIRAEMARLTGRGLHPVERGAQARGGQQARLLRASQECGGVLVELCQEIS
jgi:methylmalonyl-CoA/ethylmalonyl-CoA epimerase